MLVAEFAALVANMIPCANRINLLFAISTLVSPFLYASKRHHPALSMLLPLIRMFDPLNSMHFIWVSSIAVSLGDDRTYMFEIDRFWTTQLLQLWMSTPSVF